MSRTMTSIIIPVYRTAATLMRCVESIAAQQDARFEMILVDLSLIHI